MDKVKALENILDLQLGWVRAADTRLAFVISLATAMLTALAALAPDSSKWTILSGIFCTISAILIICSIVFSTLAFFPRTKGPKGSCVFFGGINDREQEQYLKALLELSEEDYISDLSNQCHRNAQIAHKKYSWAQKATALLLLVICPWLISIYLLYSTS